MNIQAINAELAKIGYKAVKLPKKAVDRLTGLTGSADRLTVWNPQTAAGRRCKAAMKFWASWPKAIGVTSYQVMGADGHWRVPNDPTFAEAVAYQKQFANRYATHTPAAKVVTNRDLGRSGI